ncbi:phage tail protein [Glaciimonas sp. GG7]
MSDSYLGQIMLSGFSFAPRGFAACNGQILPIMQYQALYSLLGVMYGGDGKTTFGLPDLRGRTPVSSGKSVDTNWQPTVYGEGNMVGVENVTLAQAQLPTHSHAANASTVTTVGRNPTNHFYSTSNSSPLYAPATGPQVVMASATIGNIGGGGSHNNMQPFQVVNFSICLSGIYPSRS